MMITVSLNGSHTRTQTVEETDYGIDRVPVNGYTQPERARTTQSMRNSMVECCLVTKSNKNIPSTTNGTRARESNTVIRLFSWIKRRLIFDDTSSLIANMRCYIAMNYACDYVYVYSIQICGGSNSQPDTHASGSNDKK